MSAPTVARPSPVAQINPWLQSLHPVYRLILRWLVIVGLTLLAFHRSLLSVVETTRGGGLGGYVWVVPLAAVLAALGVARRHRTELPIHDRQTDVIVGSMGLVLALLLHAVLLPRYALYFYLLRLDLVALWLFVVSAGIALFGLRPIIRFAWVWAMAFMVFPLPYFVMVILLGGTKEAAGVGTLTIAGVATGIAVGRHWRRGLLGAAFAWLVGLLVLAVLAVAVPAAPLLVFQMVPALTAICLVGTGMYFTARHRSRKRVFDRKMEPVAANQVWSGIAVSAVVAVALSLVHLPAPVFAPAVPVPQRQFSSGLAAPAGWHIADQTEYRWVERVYGSGSVLVRQKMVADTGDPRFDKFGRPRTIMVDTITATRPFAFNAYPARVLYRIKGVRLSDTRPVDLGYGVRGDMFTAIDDSILVTWDAVQWTWTNGAMAQRVLAFAVDNHEPDAPFPEPTGALGPTLNSLFTVLFRGNSAVYSRDMVFKDSELLTQFGHDLVRAQLEPLGVKP